MTPMNALTLNGSTPELNAAALNPARAPQPPAQPGAFARELRQQQSQAPRHARREAEGGDAKAEAPTAPRQDDAGAQHVDGPAHPTAQRTRAADAKARGPSTPGGAGRAAPTQDAVASDTAGAETPASLTPTTDAGADCRLDTGTAALQAPVAPVVATPWGDGRASQADARIAAGGAAEAPDAAPVAASLVPAQARPLDGAVPEPSDEGTSKSAAPQAPQTDEGDAAARDQPLTEPHAPEARASDPALPLPGLAAVLAASLAPTQATTLATEGSPDAPPLAGQIEPEVGSPGFAPALGARLTLLARDGVQEARLALHPADMGPITVQIALDGAAAHIHFLAERADTRAFIESSLPALAASLREGGFTLSGGGVSQQGQGGARPDAGADPGRRHGRASPADAAQSPGVMDVTARRPSAPRGVVDLYA